MNVIMKKLCIIALVVLVTVIVFICLFSFYKLVTSPSLLFLLFVVLTIILHLIIKYKNLNELEWKIVDYAWLLLTVVGILGISGDIKRYMSESFLKNQEKPRLENSYTYLYDFIHEYASPDSRYCVDKIWINSEYAPTKVEFDKYKKLSEQQCLMIQSIAKKLPKEIKEPYVNLNDLGLPNNLDSIEDEFLSTTYRDNYNNYSEQYQIYLNTEKETDRSGGTFYLFLFSPLLLCAGLAIRITKATGEILIYRNKNKSQ